MKAPFVLETPRLMLRPPSREDAPTIFDHWARDTAVTRFLAFATHEDLNDTHAFIALSEQAWKEDPAGPYLVIRREDGRVLGSTGLVFETPLRATTGYVFERTAWGNGYATEATRAMMDVARSLEVQRLSAEVHPDNTASIRVLEKCGFHREGLLRRHTEFVNLDPGRAADVVSFAVWREAGRMADWQKRPGEPRQGGS